MRSSGSRVQLSGIVEYTENAHQSFMKKIFRDLLIATFIIAIYAFPQWVQAQKYSDKVWRGVVTHVSDGDTLWVRPEAGGDAVDIRIDAIDAPEICQDFGPEARAALAARVLHKAVDVSPKRRDGYGRLLARLREPAGGAHSGADRSSDLGAWLVSSGNAWAHQYKSFKRVYGQEQAQAQAARKGLFANAQAVQPRVFRKQHGPCAHKVKKRMLHKK